MQDTGDFGCGGDRRIHARLVLDGIFADGYDDFLRDKARRLSLSLTLTRRDQSVIAELSGPEALIGAFEMSAIIGPQDCQISAWHWELWQPR